MRPNTENCIHDNGTGIFPPIPPDRHGVVMCVKCLSESDLPLVWDLKTSCTFDLLPHVQARVAKEIVKNNNMVHSDRCWRGPGRIEHHRRGCDHGLPK